MEFSLQEFILRKTWDQYLQKGGESRSGHRERSKCDAFVIADVPNFSASSELEWPFRIVPNWGKMFRFMFPRWSVMVCVTLIKVAFCSRGNCWKGWELKVACWQTPAVGLTGLLVRRDLGNISECLLSVIIFQSVLTLAMTAFHGQTYSVFPPTKPFLYPAALLFTVPSFLQSFFFSPTFLHLISWPNTNLKTCKICLAHFDFWIIPAKSHSVVSKIVSIASNYTFSPHEKVFY